VGLSFLLSFSDIEEFQSDFREIFSHISGRDDFQSPRPALVLAISARSASQPSRVASRDKRL